MPKQIVISKLGGPEVLEYQNYELSDQVNDNEVRIKHTAIGLNYIDTYHRSGIYPLPSDLPVCPGLEATGEIIKIGSKVKDFSIGDRVAYATTPMGAYCEIRDFPNEKLIKIPDNLNNDEVEAIVQGRIDDILNITEKSKSGPNLALVEGVIPSIIYSNVKYTGFIVKYEK